MGISHSVGSDINYILISISHSVGIDINSISQIIKRIIIKKKITFTIPRFVCIYKHKLKLKIRCFTSDEIYIFVINKQFKKYEIISQEHDKWKIQNRYKKVFSMKKLNKNRLLKRTIRKRIYEYYKGSFKEFHDVYTKFDLVLSNETDIMLPIDNVAKNMKYNKSKNA